MSKTKVAWIAMKTRSGDKREDTLMANTFPRFAAATLAGLTATLPMSLTMLLWHRRLPWFQRDPLLPAKITHEALRSSGLADDLSAGQEMAATVASHFGYGAASGAVFGLVTSKMRGTLSPVTAGVAFGLGVWTASYLGWLPAIGWHRSAVNEPAPRNWLMIGSHVVYGASLGLMTDLLSRRNHGERRN